MASFEQHYFDLPRPGQTAANDQPIAAPSEANFTATFGALLPPAKYIDAAHGRAAYYEIFSPPSTLNNHNPSTSDTSDPSESTSTPTRVLLIHGIQTPALGLLSLASALQTTLSSSSSSSSSASASTSSRSASKQTHFILLDLWGHGLTSTPNAPHTPSLFHDLIDALLSHLSWPTAHLIGYSFGAMLVAGYVATRAQKVDSYALIAPAGMIPSGEFPEDIQSYLQNPFDSTANNAAGKDARANGVDEAEAALQARTWISNILSGPMLLPQDWQTLVSQGQIVPNAVKHWELREHRGHAASVVAIFRDGGVLDNTETFRQALATRVPSVVVLGKEDDVCSEAQVRGLGFGDVSVIEGVGHEVVRERAEEVAGFLGAFWKGLGIIV